MKIFTLVAYAVVFCLSGADKGEALQFEKVQWKGRSALSVTGEIVQGDAKRFATALSQIKPSLHGLPLVLLNSVGGSVGEALLISELFSQVNVHTIVPEGAKCASACASIVFVAGKNRTVEDGGLLGQHSCSMAGKKNQECNDVISNHAFAHGVSHGSIAAFINFAGPETMLWFSRTDADCWGITHYPFTLESRFEKSEPCAIEMIVGKKPKAQSAWRIDFDQDGYRAFVRPVADDERELELNLFCSSKVPGVLNLSIDIKGPATTIKSAILNASLVAAPVDYKEVAFSVSQADGEFSRVTIQIKREDVAALLKSADEISFMLSLKKPYTPIRASTFLADSRKALIFAANHCKK